MHDHIPGIEVDDATFERMEGLEGDAAKQAGIAIAVDVVARLRELPDVAGRAPDGPGLGGGGGAAGRGRRGAVDRGALRPAARAAVVRRPAAVSSGRRA